MKIKLSTTLLKSSVLVIVLAALPIKLAIPVCLLIIVIYPYLVALLYGVRAMPALDSACFYGIERSNVNIMSYTILDRRSFERIKEIFTPVVMNNWKLTYHL